MAIFLAYYNYLTDPYSVFDDQRNILKTVKKYDYSSFDYNFYSSPLYFILFVAFNNLIPDVIIVKLLFILTVPFFIVYIYNIGRIINKESGSENLHIPIMFTVLNLLFYSQMLINGYSKSLAFIFLLGVIYFTLVNKKILAILNLVLVAFIYPPQFVIGLASLFLYYGYEILTQWKVRRSQIKFKDLRRLNSIKMICILLIFLVAYSAYYFTLNDYRPTGTKNIPSVSFNDASTIDNEIKEEIDRTRTDFVPSVDKYLGIVPKHYLNDKRMGMFGMTGGIRPWVFFTFVLLVMLLIKKQKFLIPPLISILFVTSVILYFLAHVFYKNLYFPSRYTWFTFPFIAIFLFVINLSPSIKKLTSAMLIMKKKYSFALILIPVSLVFLLFYLFPHKKLIYFSSKYNYLDLLIFTILIVLLLISSVFLMMSLSRRYQMFKRYIHVSTISCFLIFMLVILNVSLDRKSSPVNSYDKELFPAIDKLGAGISFCGYPELRDKVHALVPTRIKVNFGQTRQHNDAYEFFHLLSAYYSGSLEDVYRYMFTKNYDFFIIQKVYFHSGFTEGNQLFSFYPILRSFEEKLKKENLTKFVLLNPPEEIIEFESKKSIVISFQKLRSFSNFSMAL